MSLRALVCSGLLDLGRSGATWHRSLGPELGAPTATGGVETATLKNVRRGMQCDASGGEPRSYILRLARVVGITQAPVPVPSHLPDLSDAPKKWNKTHARTDRVSSSLLRFRHATMPSSARNYFSLLSSIKHYYSLSLSLSSLNNMCALSQVNEETKIAQVAWVIRLSLLQWVIIKSFLSLQVAL